MVTPSQAEHLLLPLLVRAHAVRTWPQVGFVDQAAEYLVRKLELDQQPWGGFGFVAQHQLELERCKWVDQQVLDFLEQYPHALGVELGGGLSTRFQRLSAATDWPRFAWADVDSYDVIECADLIFPHTDNYRLVPCDFMREDWVQKIGWRQGQPLIVVVEALPDGTSLKELRFMLNSLMGAVETSSAPVQLILDYASPTLQKFRSQLKTMLYGRSCGGFVGAMDLMEKLGLPGRVISEHDLAANTRGPLLHRLLARLYRRLTGNLFWGVVRLGMGVANSSD